MSRRPPLFRRPWPHVTLDELERQEAEAEARIRARAREIQDATVHTSDEPSAFTRSLEALRRLLHRGDA